MLSTNRRVALTGMICRVTEYVSLDLKCWAVGNKLWWEARNEERVGLVVNARRCRTCVIGSGVPQVERRGEHTAVSVQFQSWAGVQK